MHLLHKGIHKEIPKGSKSTRRLDKHLQKIRKSLNHVVLKKTKLNYRSQYGNTGCKEFRGGVHN